MSGPRVNVVPVLSDNFAFIVQAAEAVVIIDPGEAEPIREVLDRESLKPTHVLITHYDYDHVDGLAALTEKFHLQVIGPEPERVSLDRICRDGEGVELGGLVFRVIDTPGHYIPHVSFYVESMGWLFSGDSMFGSGCGRVRNNAYKDMYESLQKVAALPDSTSVYFGHEYTLSNLAFAASVEPGSADIAEYRSQISKQLSEGRPSVPSTLAMEKKTNPFVRLSSPEIRKSLNMANEPDVDVFTALRRAKDVFAG